MPRFFRVFPKRFSLVAAFLQWFLTISTGLRIALICWQIHDISLRPDHILLTLIVGFFFDIATAAFITFPAVLYFAIFPNALIGSKPDRIFASIFFGLTVFLVNFSFFAEITFWEEFRSRFNFIAVDYLIYTHEVVANIRESYPLPLLIGGILAATALAMFIFWKRSAFFKSFHSKATTGQRLFTLAVTTSVVLFAVFFVKNGDAEWSANRYNSEISKSGIYSFFAAMRNNRMDYARFYTTIPNPKSFEIVRKKLQSSDSEYVLGGTSIRRIINDSAAIQKKNVVFILVESLSSNFMGEFGNEENITPFLDSLAGKSIFFENLFATGTRTVRGMEAVTLCIPPTPGQSIVKRPENSALYTVSDVFAKKGYDNNFFYGGDGYFDNMNAYFGGNGFTIYDRGRGSVLSDDIKAERHNINDNEVTFENAWGICDGDLYRKMLSVADAKYNTGKPFFNFVMTTSNHRPYSYPEGQIDLPSGKSRQGAVKYTDFALGEMFRQAKKKPWYANTVFVVVADHCAKSAGKDEIDVANYHIPAFIVNLPDRMNQKVQTQCSQIDLFPTLFYLFHWRYESNFFGKNVLDQQFEPRAFVATYRKLGYLKGTELAILSDQKKQGKYRWNPKDNTLKPLPPDKLFFDEAIAWYQSADFMFAHKLLK